MILQLSVSWQLTKMSVNPMCQSDHLHRTQPRLPRPILYGQQGNNEGNVGGVHICDRRKGESFQG